MKLTLSSKLLAAVFACGLILFGAAAETPGKPVLATASSRDYYVSRAGSDSSPGTARRPWRTLHKAVSRLRPGDTAFLRPGTYGSRGSTTRMARSGTPSAPITIAGLPGARRPKVLGHVYLSGSRLKLSRIRFDGPTGQVRERSSDNPGGEWIQVEVTGDNVEISRSEIANNTWHAGIYVYQARGVRILRNHIHDNGSRLSAQANLCHGVYWDSGSGVVADNVIEDNVSWGVHLYPSPDGVTVANNTIVRNRKGGVIVSSSARHSLIVNNVIAHNHSGISTWSLDGNGNIARNNLLWANRNGNLDSVSGLSATDNKVANPRFRASNDYHLRGNSPAVNRADRQYSPSVDYDGISRKTRGAPDIGAFEAR